MIEDIRYGDITAPDNRRDIVIGMNTRCAEASAIGRKVLLGKTLAAELELGDVVTFAFDEKRNLHLLICHELREGGWENSERFVRFGLDYLWQRYRDRRQFAIVRIGKGPIGISYGAPSAAIQRAMDDSFLPLLVYFWDQGGAEARAAEISPLVPFRRWGRNHGESDIRRVQ